MFLFKKRTQKHQSKGAGDFEQDFSAGWHRTRLRNYSHRSRIWKVQESTFKLLFESKIHSLTLRVDSVVKDLQEIKISVQYTQNDVEDLKPIQVKLEGLNKEIDKIIKDLASHSQRLEYLKNQSRRNNIHVNVILESDNETWGDAEVKVKRTIKNNLGIKLDIEGSPGGKAENQVGTSKPESAENHRV